MQLQGNITGLTIRGCIRSIVSSEASSVLTLPLLPLLESSSLGFVLYFIYLFIAIAQYRAEAIQDKNRLFGS